MKKTILFLVVAFILVLSITFIANSPDTDTDMALKSQTGTAVVPVANTGGSIDTSGAPTQSNTFTMADVAQHRDINSCWFVVNGKVYDGTSWIPMHPGGEQAILSLCGRDGTSAFDNQHGGQRRPEQELASLQIGTLTQ
jgi:cytochrome b involved in lipid metabolism